MPRAPRTAEHPELGLPETRKLWQTEWLFSDHYLKTRIARNSWWPTDAEAEPIWQFCRELYEKRYVACARNNEQFTRQELLDKILERLGFAWTDNLGLPESQQHLEPDYILYGSAAEKEAVIDCSASERYRSAIAVLEAKKVNHPLSQRSASQLRYPHQQIRDYLNEAQLLGWAILTSGNEWRLYARDAKPSHYFSLDFSAAIQSLEKFKYFVALFSPAAFVRDAEGSCRLDEVRDSALATQVELEEDLRLRIFTILEILANGFFSREENQISETDLPLLYDRCLIFFYRLLFILYAEGRDLLPVQPRSRRYYKDLSLARLTTALKNFSAYDSHTRTRLFEDVRELCHLINGTDEKKNREYDVPRYNGGLFEAARYPELERWRVSDAVLADVLRGMMFSPLPQRDQPSLPVETVDFGDLRVQQLGSIYEGLMEHHFHRDATTLKLVADKAERRQTGTYYTPDYIVKYIVDQTLRPLLDEIEASEPVKNSRTAARHDNSFADAVLRLNVCDPAMGSGHFLVEATTFLAEQIVYHPTTKFQATKERGVPQEQTEIAYWRRRVVESCIYGVDLNPLAVELAKLSLWLTTIATDQPLNFLDHHLHCGNSLIGARVDQLGALAERKKKSETQSPTAEQTQFTFGPDFQRVISETIGQIHSIEERASADVNSVKEKEKRWQEKVLPALAPYKAVADLWTSAFFGNTLKPLEYIEQAQQILAGHKIENGPARIRRFFHWELEFPEVFFNDDGARRQGGGFDAVVGNPPYVRIQGFPKLDVAYLSSRFASATGNADVYVSFIERGYEVLRLGGRLGEIVPNKFMKTDYGVGLRRLIATEHALRSIIDFGASQVFSVTIYTCLLFLERRSRAEFRYTQVDAGPPNLGRSEFLHLPMSSLAESGWSFQRPVDAQLTAKLRSASTRLLDLPAEMSRGSSSGDDKIFIFENLDIEPEVCRRPIFATDFTRYTFAPEHDWKIIFPYVRRTNDYQLLAEPDFESRFPKAFAHLKAEQAKLERRKQYPVWYGYSAARNLILHDRAQMIVPLLADRGMFAAIPDHTRGALCPMASGGFTIMLHENASVDPNYVLALLNSKLLFRELQRISNVFRGGWVTCTKQYVGELPIRRIEFNTPEKERVEFAAKLKQFFASGSTGEVLRFVEQQLVSKPQRSDVVHDLLAFLAQDMTRLNAEKRATARGFIVDLRDFHGVKAHALTPKTRLDEFWKLDAAELFAHLRKNARRLAEQNVRLAAADEEKIRERFTQARETIVPLEPRIAATDALIDQIVYRLYGLTKEEIGLVESDN